MRNDEILRRTEEGVKESNKILIQELIYDLETRGISPVISIDGEVKKLTLIAGDELKNFDEELQKFSLCRSDFCLLKADKINEVIPSLCCPQDVVVVVDKKTYKLKEYRISPNQSWLNSLHHDLENGFFSS